MRKDISQKNYLDNPVRIADLINGFHFHGLPFVKAEDIQRDDSQIPVMKDDVPDSLFSHDLIRKIINGTSYWFLGLENQDSIDYSMVIRTLICIANGYYQQVRRLSQAHRAAKDLPSKTFTSRIAKEDLLIPITVLVLYFGKEPWDAALSLHDLLDFSGVPRELRHVFADYQMHVLDVRRYQETRHFHSDLRLLFGFLQADHDQKLLKNFIADNTAEFSRLPSDLYSVLRQLSGIRNMKPIDELTKKKGMINMCKALDDMVHDAEENTTNKIIAEISDTFSEIIPDIQNKLAKNRDGQTTSAVFTGIIQDIRNQYLEKQDEFEEERQSFENQRQDFENQRQELLSRIRELESQSSFPAS
ncbi:MAG: hypothetical protein SOZ59_14690 [Candidatus Limivivens sp.]|nr:hypothetical protein [Candidatus Limivivens sp.]